MTRVQGTVRALHDHVIVSDMHFGERVTTSGIVLLDDNAKSRGIRPRWGCVQMIGPEQQDVKPGDWILVSHGRWSRGFSLTDDQGQEQILRRVDAKDILAISDHCPSHDDTINTDAA
jgi:co-chaperonin GroES (HSP10)